MKDHAAEGPVACQKLVRRKLLRKTSELYSKSGTQRWKSFLGYLQIPVWLMVIETIRRMCGDREGFLGMIRDRFFGSQSGSTLNYQEDMSKLESPETNSETMGGMDMISPPIGGIPVGIAEEPLIPLEPALATEGMLWFPNLLLPDPNLMLSFVLSGSLLANIFYQERYSRKRGWMPGPIQRGFGHAFKIAALAVGPLTLSFPSAVHLYLISSSLFGLTNTILLKTFLPIPTTLQTTKPEGSHDHNKGASIKWKGEGRQMPDNRRRRERKRHQA
ncbi:MAG: hypothetical protein L6R35_001282 [Caloplaca aegaea]|nr:MAG: hypothetical protein L6R35_001282 [Caloplaca aegaea]